MKFYPCPSILLFASFFGFAGNSGAKELVKPAIAAGNSGFSQPLPGSNSLGDTGGFDAASEFLLPVAIGVSTSSYYDTNLNQSAPTATVPVEEDFVQSFASTAQWARQTSLWSANIGAFGSCELPLSTEDSNTFRYGSNSMGAYHAGRFELGIKLNQSLNEESNRFYGGVVRQASFGTGVSAAYELSPKTSVVATCDSMWMDGEGEVSSTESLNANVSGMWKYSPLLQFGPGIAWTQNSGKSLDDRSTLGPSLAANYRLSSKVGFQGMLGWNFINGGDLADDGSAPGLSTSISASYALNRLWGLSLSLNRGVQADGIAGLGFRESTVAGFAVNRKVADMNAVLDIGYDHTSYIQSTSSPARNGIDYFTSSLSVSMPVIVDGLNATLFVRYNDSSSDDPIQDWDSCQLGCSLGYQF